MFRIQGRCELCGRESDKISRVLSVCLNCIRDRPDRALEIADGVHARSRRAIGLPPAVPRDREGAECTHCANNCRIPEGERGYCNLSRNVEGKLVRDPGTSRTAVGSWYRDPHPTNCIPGWCCAGGTGSGYPSYAKTPQGDTGYNNAAVFLGTCCYDCLYCQNTSWHRMASQGRPLLDAEDLVEEVLSDESITCLCWFGGTPEPQSPFVHRVSRVLRDKARGEDRMFRICLEANGNFSPRWLEKIAEISLESGGGIKFDLKARDGNLNRVLSGLDNQPTYDNFRHLGELHSRREEPPFLRASTLLVPGYIDVEEVARIARFISGIDPSIPYSLLAFAPAYKLSDLPTTERDLAFRAQEVAQDQGLERVRVGNKHLLR